MFIKLYAVVIKRGNDEVRIQIVNRPCLHLDFYNSYIQNESIAKLKGWFQDIWYCNPSTLLITNFNRPTHEFIKTLSTFESIRYIKIINFDFEDVNNKKNMYLLNFVKSKPKLKVILPSNKNGTDSNNQAIIKYLSQALIFVHKYDYIPIKFKTNLIDITEGYIKKVVKLDDQEYAVVSQLKWQYDTFEIQYDSESETQAINEIKRLQQIRSLDYLTVLLRIQDIWSIEASQHFNIYTIFNSLSLRKIKVIQSWFGYDIHRLIESLNHIPRKWSLELYSYNFNEDFKYNKEIKDFFKIISEFQKVTFISNKDNQIHCKGIEVANDTKDTNEMLFRIWYEKNEEVVNYKLLSSILIYF